MNRPGLTLTLALALLSGAGGPAPAQVIDAEGEKVAPGKKLKTEAPPVWVAYAGYVPWTSPAAKTRKPYPYTRDGKPASIPFMHKLSAISAGTQSGDQQYRLLAEMDSDSLTVKKVIGWVDIRYLVEEEPVALIDEFTQIYRKAMIVTRPAGWKELLKEAEDAKIDKEKAPKAVEVPIRHEPRHEGKVEKSIRLFNLLHIYADSEPGKDNEDKGFYLVGKAYRFEPDDATQVILGWVPKTHLVGWNTREALEWHTASSRPAEADRRAHPGLVFRNIKHAQKAAADLTPRSDAKAFKTAFDLSIFREALDAKTGSPPMRHGQLRYPILKDFAKGPAAGTKTNPLYRIGAYGGLVGPDGAIGPGGEELENLREKVRAIVEQTKTVEVMFVIDSTASMVWCFKEVANTFDKLVASLKDEGRTLRVGLTFYSDISDPKDDPDKAVELYKEGKLYDFATEGSAMSAHLRQRAKDEVKDGDDPPEQVFRGLAAGLRKPLWTAYARKMVILIGDFGNNARFDKGRKNVPTETSLAAALNPATGLPIELYAIQAINPEHDFRDVQKNAAAKGFRTQAREILRLCEAQRKKAYKEYGAGELPPHGKYLALKDKDDLAENLRDRFADLKKRSADMGKKIAEMAELGIVTQSDLGPEMAKIFKENRIDYKQFLTRRAQVMEIGYVWHKNHKNQQQVARRVLLTYGEARAVIKVLEDHLLPKDPGSEKEPLEVLDALVEAQTAEQNPAKRKAMSAQSAIQKRLKKRAGALEFQSPLLTRALKDLTDPKFNEQEKRELKLRLMKLQDLVPESGPSKVYNYVRKDARSNWQRSGKGNPVLLDDSKPDQKKRWFHLAGDSEVRYYWVDYETEWP